LNGEITEFNSGPLLGVLYSQREGEIMPDDPSECREQARRCADLACTAPTPEDREHFASLAKSWIRLADELENAHTLLNALDQIEADEHSEAA
jgi:hypothetical protein